MDVLYQIYIFIFIDGGNQLVKEKKEENYTITYDIQNSLCHLNGTMNVDAF